MNFARRLFRNSSNKISYFSKSGASSQNNWTYSKMISLASTALGAHLLWNHTELFAPMKASFEDDIQRLEIGNSDDFAEGVLREIRVGEDEVHDTILVVRHEGKLYATGSKCSHIGAPLIADNNFGDRLYCGYHLASFNIKTGYPEYGPVYDGIPTYPIHEAHGQVYVDTPKKIKSNNNPLPTVTRDPENKKRFVIIGGGIAGGSAAETLRQNGFTGEIIMLSAEEDLPYDRTALTKGDGYMLTVEPEQILWRKPEYFDKLGIDFRGNTLVTKVNANTKLITTKSGDTLTYDKLLVASGTSAVVPQLPGVQSNNVFTIRNITDVKKIRETVANGVKNIVVIGGSYIGVEAASSLKLGLKDAANITVVSGGNQIYHNTVGSEVGRGLRVLSERNGVNFELGSRLASIESDEEGNAKTVVLENGKKLDADLVILGTGVTPNTWFLEGGVALDADGGINADPFLRSTSHKDVYAAGDIVSYPYFYTAERVRNEHISEAISTGSYAAKNMLGKMVPYDQVPFFWTRAFNKSISYVGNISAYDNVVIDGDVDNQKFVAYYLKNSRVIAAAGMQSGNDLALITQAMKLNLTIDKSYFNGTKFDSQKLRQKVVESSPKCKCRRTAEGTK